jgi:hypothetical protein
MPGFVYNLLYHVNEKFLSGTKNVTHDKKV